MIETVKGEMQETSAEIIAGTEETRETGELGEGEERGEGGERGEAGERGERGECAEREGGSHGWWLVEVTEAVMEEALQRSMDSMAAQGSFFQRIMEEGVALAAMDLPVGGRLLLAHVLTRIHTCDFGAKVKASEIGAPKLVTQKIFLIKQWLLKVVDAFPQYRISVHVEVNDKRADGLCDIVKQFQVSKLYLPVTRPRVALWNKSRGTTFQKCIKFLPSGCILQAVLKGEKWGEPVIIGEGNCQEVMPGDANRTHESQGHIKQKPHSRKASELFSPGFSGETTEGSEKGGVSNGNGGSFREREVSRILNSPTAARLSSWFSIPIRSQKTHSNSDNSSSGESSFRSSETTNLDSLNNSSRSRTGFAFSASLSALEDEILSHSGTTSIEHGFLERIESSVTEQENLNFTNSIDSCCSIGEGISREIERNIARETFTGEVSEREISNRAFPGHFEILEYSSTWVTERQSLLPREEIHRPVHEEKQVNGTTFTKTLSRDILLSTSVKEMGLYRRKDEDESVNLRGFREELLHPSMAELALSPNNQLADQSDIGMIQNSPSPSSLSSSSSLPSDPQPTFPLKLPQITTRSHRPPGLQPLPLLSLISPTTKTDSLFSNSTEPWLPQSSNTPSASTPTPSPSPLQNSHCPLPSPYKPPASIFSPNAAMASSGSEETNFIGGTGIWSEAVYQDWMLKYQMAMWNAMQKQMEVELEKVRTAQIEALQQLQTEEHRQQILQQAVKRPAATEPPIFSRQAAVQIGSMRNFEFNLYSVERITEACEGFSEKLLIGRGGYGDVYLAELDHMKVAVKRIKVTPRTLEGFKKEVEVHSPLRHSNIVQFIGCCIDEERPCLVTEYMSGGSLESRLRRKEGSSQPPLHWTQRVEIFKDVCCGLLYLHQRDPSIIHRDIKPANILLSKNLQGKIADVGLAHVMDNVRFGESYVSFSEPFAVGSKGYVDPEYIHMGKAGPSSDVFAVGMVLVDLLHGLTHWDLERRGSFIQKMEQAVQSENYEKLIDLLDISAGTWPRKVAMELAKIALGCTELSRKKRPDLVKGVLKVLEGLEGELEKGKKVLLMKEKMEVEADLELRHRCPITKEVMEWPVVAADGHSYEREAIERWIGEGHRTSPMTNGPLDNFSLVPNNDLRSAIQNWKERWHESGSVY